MLWLTSVYAVHKASFSFLAECTLCGAWRADSRCPQPDRDVMLSEEMIWKYKFVMELRTQHEDAPFI